MMRRRAISVESVDIRVGLLVSALGRPHICVSGTHVERI
jgi:hypothetical protein